MNALDVIGSICLVLAVFLLIWRVSRLDRRMWTLEHRYCQQDIDGCACGRQDCIMGGPE